MVYDLWGGRFCVRRLKKEAAKALKDRTRQAAKQVAASASAVSSVFTLDLKLLCEAGLLSAVREYAGVPAAKTRTKTARAEEESSN